MPILVKVGLIHSQFETIHPFEDGNGPIGRLLVLLSLVEAAVLSQPLLYLSSYFMKHRKEYYDRLQTVRDQGDWESWLKFFLRAILHSSQHAAGVAVQIVQQRETHRLTIAQEMGTNAACGLLLLEELYPHPIMSVEQVAKITKKNPNDAKKLIAMFQRLGVLKEITGRARGQYFAFDPYLNLFTDKTADSRDEQSSTPPEQITEAAGIDPS
ncbi:MAG: Fic family protein [Fidelibacterota bacterium]|nr:MAG: Fic family protein [Candidatus Neomarinimicrobiota bacterium]